MNRGALKALGVFFAAMLLLTLVARAADSLLIANVKTMRVASGALSHEAQVQGTVESADARTVWGPKGQRVAKVCVRNGMVVKQGDVLLELDPQLIAEQLDAAKAALDKLVNDRAQLELDAPDAKEEKKLKKHKLLLSAQNAEIIRARAALRKLETLRADAKVRAAADGTVTHLAIQAGKEVGGEALMQLSLGEGGLILTVKLTREQAEYVSAGDGAKVALQGKSQSSRAQVQSISQPDDKGQVEVVLALADAALPIAARCDVKFVRTTDGYPSLVPVSALRADFTGEYVLVLRDEKSVLGDTQVAQRVPVMVLDRDGAKAAVEGALMDTDLVITGWDKPVESGDRVRAGAS